MDQPLDWQRVAQAVARQTIGCHVEYRAVTGSTNDDARALAQGGAPEGVVVVADTQTRGRGRTGKSPWLTPPRTSIAVSIILHPRQPEALARISMLAGVAAAEAITEVAGVPARLKWPNDVMIGERKVGGVLVESALAGSSVAFAIAGVGINGNLPAAALGPLPDAAVPPATLLDEVGHEVEREALLIRLLEHFDRLYRQLQVGEAAAVAQRYRVLLDTLGRRVRLLGVDAAPVEGVAEAVDNDGTLVLRLDSGERRAFLYGEVSCR